MTDNQREELINTYYKAMLSAKTTQKKQVYFRWIQRLIAGRSPEQVKRMESQL